MSTGSSTEGARFAAIGFLVGALPVLAAGPQPHAFTLDPKRTEVVVRVFRAGFAAGLAHNHVVRAREVSGEGTWDPAAPEATRVRVSVPAAALVADEPAWRTRFGESSQLSQADQRKVTLSMLGDEQLEASKYPTIHFVSTGAYLGPKGALVVVGELTLHGVTRRVSVQATVAMKEGVVIGDGRLWIRGSDYGLRPYSAALGAIRNRDEVQLVLHLVGAPASGN